MLVVPFCCALNVVVVCCCLSSCLLLLFVDVVVVGCLFVSLLCFVVCWLAGVDMWCCFFIV